VESFAAAVAFTEPDAQGRSLIEAILTAAPDQAAIAARIALLAASLGLPEPDIALEHLPEKDWLAASLREFAPFRVGRFFIFGSDFRGHKPAGALALCIDSGMAFGTGRHGSTQGCLWALQDLARARQFRNVLDLGCGSGILSLAAARLWRAKVLACDVDDEAVAATRAAAGRNGLAARVRASWGDGPARRWVARRRPFDLIVANIVPKPLLGLSCGLTRALAPNGAIVLSGMTPQEAIAVARRYRALGLYFVRCFDCGPWRTLIFLKPRRRGRSSRLVPSRCGP
jgi:ribosomal protein L11 methyltransferase